MDKLKEKLSRLMYGRYGIDQLGNFMMWAAVAMMIFGAVVRSSLIYTLALVLIVWADVRIMSKNHSKRYAENQKFLELKNRCDHRSRQLGPDRILPPRPRRLGLRKHDVAEPHYLRSCRHLRPLPDLRLRKNFRPRTGAGVRTGTLSYTPRKAV